MCKIIKNEGTGKKSKRQKEKLHTKKRGKIVQNRIFAGLGGLSSPPPSHTQSGEKIDLPPHTQLGEKVDLEGGGGAGLEMIEMHNIYPFWL